MTKKPEIPKEEDVILRKDGLYYLKDAKAAFTGISEDFYKNGKLKRIQTYKKGKLRGPYIVFYENGQKKFEGTYKYRDSVLDGYFITYHENGQEYQSAYLWKECIDGRMTESDEEGRLIKDREYEMGRFSGYYNEEEELVEVQEGYPNWGGYYDEIKEILVALPPVTETSRMKKKKDFGNILMKREN